MNAEQLIENGTSILQAIAAIRENRQKQELSLKELEMVALVMKQGIDPNDVRAYGYDPLEDKAYRKHERYPTLHREPKVTHYNIAHMKDGTRRVIDPVPIPCNQE